MYSNLNEARQKIDFMLKKKVIYSKLEKQVF